MPSAFRACIVLGVLLASSTASAQEITRSIGASSVTEPLPAFSGERLSLEDLCDRAARTARAHDWAPWGLVSCRVERTSDPELALVLVHYPDGDEALIARRERGAFRVLGVVDECLGGPDGHAGCAIRFVSLHVRETTRGTVLAIETASSSHDYDLGVLEGVRIERRHLSVCSSRGCEISVPLEVAVWSIELVERPDGSGWPFESRETFAGSSRAIAVIRRDGSVRLTLRSGAWSSLYSDTRDWADAPAAPGPPDLIVRE